MKSEKHKIKEFQALYAKFIQAKDTGDIAKFSQSLDHLGKMLIRGERQGSDFFQHFIELKALDSLLEVFSKAKSKDVVISIIGFFNMLFTNLEKSDNVNCLLSHPCVLSLQNIKFVALDNEIAEYYINFLKQLSRKLDLTSLNLFFNKKYCTFPLVMQSTRFYNHPQSLVRATCRNILLTCCKLDHPRMKDFITGFPFVVYYVNECNFVKEYWYIMDSIIDSSGDNQYQLQNLENILQDHEQLLYFIQDFMHIDPKNITNKFIDAFANQCMSYLLQSLYSHKKIHFSLNVTLFICNILVKITTNKPFLDFIIFSLFGKYYPSLISIKLMQPMDRPLSYSKQWKFKGFWDSHQQQIQQYCLKKYYSEKKTSKIMVQNEEKAPKKYSSQMRSIFGMGTNFYDREAEKLENIFGIPIKSQEQGFKKKGFSDLIQQLKQEIRQDKVDLTNCQQNPVRALIFSFAKSKDDKLVFLTLNLINEISQKKKVSEEIINFCSLNPTPINFDFKSMSDIEQIIKSCLLVLETDPPSFRICTYKMAQSLITIYSKAYCGDLSKIPQQLLDMARQALKNSIQSIKPYIYEKQKWQTSLQLFNFVSAQDNQKRQKTLYTYGFLPYEKTKETKLQDIYEWFPRNQSQIHARDLWLYIIIRDTYCQLTKTVCKFEVNICDEKNRKKASKFQIGQKYQIEEDHCINCRYKQLNEETSNQCTLIFLGGYIVIGEQGRVKFKESYENSLMIQDRSDPRNIMTQFKKQITVLIFQNAKQAYEIKKRFQQMKLLMFQYQLSMLVKQTQWMLQRIKQQ